MSMSPWEQKHKCMVYPIELLAMHLCMHLKKGHCSGVFRAWLYMAVCMCINFNLTIAYTLSPCLLPSLPPALSPNLPPSQIFVPVMGEEVLVKLTVVWAADNRVTIAARGTGSDWSCAVPLQCERE